MEVIDRERQFGFFAGRRARRCELVCTVVAGGEESTRSAPSVSRKFVPSCGSRTAQLAPVAVSANPSPPEPSLTRVARTVSVVAKRTDTCVHEDFGLVKLRRRG